jgi:hypothetical protein
LDFIELVSFEPDFNFSCKKDRDVNIAVGCKIFKELILLTDHPFALLGIQDGSLQKEIIPDPEGNASPGVKTKIRLHFIKILVAFITKGNKAHLAAYYRANQDLPRRNRPRTKDTNKHKKPIDVHAPFITDVRYQRFHSKTALLFPVHLTIMNPKKQGYLPPFYTRSTQLVTRPVTCFLSHELRYNMVMREVSLRVNVSKFRAVHFSGNTTVI